MRPVERLGQWLEAMERWWTQADDGLGWFGSGYDSWGVQTNLKYASAAAAVAARHPDASVRSWALGRARDSYRFAWSSHLSGPSTCADGRSWGHTWISALGIERAWLGLDLLGEAGADLRQDAERVLLSESDWLSTSYQRGRTPGVVAGLWADEGHNDPESNLWNGALLWRTLTRVPDAPEAPAYRDRALSFMANGVSLTADAQDRTRYDGEPLASRHIGANFFDSMALDHHGYLNLGYMAICTSQASLLYFDQAAAGLPVPDLLHLHQDVLWDRLKSCITPDGRLIRLGGDSRVRYAYCQEYVPVAALYAREHLGDEGADAVIAGYLELVAAETGDRGAFYDRRLGHIQERRPYYYTRLESDRANALAFLVAHGDRERSAQTAPRHEPTSWSDDEHGVVMVRGRRLASHSWRAFTTTQGLCVPTAHGDMAEYHLNLAPRLRLEGENTAFDEFNSGRPKRRVTSRWQSSFDDGFATVGQVLEGTELVIAEGWKGDGAAQSTIAMVALPDDATVLGLQLVRTAAWSVGLLGWHGLNLGIPNDVYNGASRELRTAGGTVRLDDVPMAGSVTDLGHEVTVDGVLTVRSLTEGAVQLLRSPTPDGGPLQSLRVETLAMGTVQESQYVPPRTTIIDVAYLMHVGGPGAAVPTTATLSASGPLRAWHVDSTGGRSWTVVVNVSTSDEVWQLASQGGTARELTGAGDREVGAALPVPALQARVVEHVAA
ncbi:hypothetical protein [Pseudactinotalea suaedae]|uniref:hypothetical protein n=1 Tax=Pseudactinotalea suaedae TaxID=1524924 RepID=UPI0012E177CC|nr:hypothetical protein [Pseudactinotalea suaedae]